MMNKKKDKLDKVIKQVFARVKKQGPKGEVCPDDEVLAAYCEGTLDEEGREKIEEHIAFCSQCAESLLAFAEAEKSYSSDVKTYSTDKMLRWVKSLVKEKERTSLWDGISNWLSPFRLRPAVVMAAVLVVVVVGLFSLQAVSYTHLRAHET